jgi:hypothetical protein
MNKNQDDIDKINKHINDILGEENEDESTKKINTLTNLKVDYDEDIIDDLKEKESEEEKEEVKEKEIKKSDNKGNNKKKKIIIISSIIVVLLIILVVVLVLVFGKNEDTVVVEEDKALTKSEQKKIINNFGDAVSGVIAIYFNNQNVLLEFDDAVKLIDFDYTIKCNNHEVYSDGSIYLDNCKINGNKTSYSYGEKQEIEEEVTSDDVINVYVNKTSSLATLTEPKNKDDYDIYEVKIDGVYSDVTLLSEYDGSYLFYFDEDYLGHMVNYKTGKKVLSSVNYSNILPVRSSDNIYSTSYVGVKVSDKWGIYNLKTREKILDTVYDYIAPYLYIGISGPATSVDCLEDNKIAVLKNDYYGVIDFTTGNEVIPIKYKTLTKSGKYLWATDSNGDGHIFDYSGNEYLNDKYDKIYGIVDGIYILVNDNNSIKMVKIDGKVLYDYGKLDLGNYNYGLYYNDQAIFQFYSTDTSDYENCIEIAYDSSTKKGEAKNYMCGGIAKPILYLYPKKKTKVTISFEHPELLQTTYPKFTSKWEVTAYSNGDLYDSNGNYYYALYWDEAQVHSVDFSTGYYVEKDDAITFLEEKLTYIGLNAKERNEFIMYWLPVLEKNGKNLVYFELTEERESYNKINISPKPDSLLRVVIHIKKVNEKVDIKKESLTKFKRSGFTAVEWGGTTY